MRGAVPPRLHKRVRDVVLT